MFFVCHRWCWLEVSPYLYHMLVEFERNRMVQSTQNFELDKKKKLTIFDKALRRHFGRHFCSWNNGLMLNFHLSIQIAQFRTWGIFIRDTAHFIESHENASCTALRSLYSVVARHACNQVKSCTKYARPVSLKTRPPQCSWQHNQWFLPNHLPKGNIESTHGQKCIICIWNFP